MKILQRGKTKFNRALDAARDWKMEVECEECDTLMEINANDLEEFAVPNYLAVVCGLSGCGHKIEIGRDEIEPDVLLYVDFVLNKKLDRAVLP